jgi:2-methylisocitrate lyase-like PEP mutase family enzyme
MPRGVRAREDLAFFRQAVPDIPLVVITGADDISVQEYGELGYQLLIYATTPVIVAASALMQTYQHLKETGRLNISAQQVAELRRQVEELISLPEYYEVEAATTEKGHAAPAAQH